MDKPLKDAVKERMVELKMSVADLAAVTGISAGRIYKWYDEKRPFLAFSCLCKMQLFCQALNVNG